MSQKVMECVGAQNQGIVNEGKALERGIINGPGEIPVSLNRKVEFGD